MHPLRAEEIFAAALGIADPRERRSYVIHACAGDEGLKQEVESLLAAHAQGSTFMGAAASAGFAMQPPEANPVLGSSAPLREKSGDRIGRYKLLEQIGEGGFGVVWMAEQDEPVRRRVALKIIKLGMDTRQVIARFEAERQALALMDHPSIAQVFDGGATETGRPYFVMELVRGVAITDYCDAQKMSTEERLALFMQVCQAVQHAHQKGVIHRDLKPSNILVTELDGKAVPKVIDFGVAKATQSRLTEKTVFTRFHQMIGTPAYMSPEQAGLGGLDIDTRSDIYSLGVVLYELLTGHTPFDTRKLLEEGYEAILRTIREEEPSKPSTRLSTLTVQELCVVAAKRKSEPSRLNRLVRGDLDWIVMKALDKNRKRRYETANSLERDVLRHLKSEPVVARPPGRAYRLQKLVLRNKLAFAATGISATALVAGFGTSTWMYFREFKLRQRAEIAEQTAQIEASQLGEALMQVGRLDEAEGIIRQAMVMQQKLLGDASPEVAASINSLAKVLLRKGTNLPEAERICREGLALQGRLPNHSDAAMAGAFMTLGDILRAEGKQQEAERVYAQFGATATRLTTHDDPDRVAALDNLVVAARDQGRLGEAEQLAREALAMRTRLFGSKHLNRAYSLDSLATVLELERKSAEREACFRESLEIRRSHLPQDHLEIAYSLDNLAFALRDEKKMPEAELLERQALAIRRKLLSKDDGALAYCLDNLAFILRSQGKTEEARTLEQEARAINASQLVK